MSVANSGKTQSILYEVSFDNDEPYGIGRIVERAAASGPIVVAFPGNGLNPKDKDAPDIEKMAKLANLLKNIMLKAGVNQEIIRKTLFYVAANRSPNDFSDKDARTLLFKKHRQAFMDEDVSKGTDGFSAEEENPAYIEALYDQIIKPRVSRLNGKVKTDAKTAAQNTAQVMFYAHCNGAYTVLKLEELMRQKMQKLGNTDWDISDIQKHITAVAYAPACPLGVSKMNFVSFKSLNDTVTGEHYNNALLYASQRIIEDRTYWTDKNLRQKETSEEGQPFDFKFSFYPDKQGNVFVIKQKGDYKDLIHIDGDEIWVDSFNLSDKEHNNIAIGDTEDSKQMYYVMRRVLANAILQINNPQAGVQDPLSVRDLAVGKISQDPAADGKTFDDACQTGKKQFAEFCRDIKRLMYEQTHGPKA